MADKTTVQGKTPKSLKEILNGVKKSNVEKLSLGTEPGVDFQPKSPAEQKAVDAHSVEKHDDREGNGDDVYNGDVKNVDYKKNVKSVKGKTEKEAIVANEEVETIDETLTKSQPASKWIKDFIKSKNPKFDGKSEEERKKMALGAYYSKQNENTNEEVETNEEITESESFEPEHHKIIRNTLTKQHGYKVIHNDAGTALFYHPEKNHVVLHNKNIHTVEYYSGKHGHVATTHELHRIKNPKSFVNMHIKSLDKDEG